MSWMIVAVLAVVVLLLAVKVWELRQDIEMHQVSYNTMKLNSERKLGELKGKHVVLMNFVGAIENMAQGTRNKVEAK